MTDTQEKGKDSVEKAALLPGGYFITFEGGEGVGKSTQINHLAGYLRKEGFEVVVTREPGGTPGAESVRYLLSNNHMQNYRPAMEEILFAAARIDHVDRVIVPALEAGKIVLCDRFIDSTRVYQGANHKLAQGYISLLEKIAVGLTMPHTTFILDLPAKKGMARVHARQKDSEKTDHFEKADLDIQERRRQAFLTIAKREPNRCHVIDAARPIDIIAAEIAAVSDRKIHEWTI